MDLSLWRSEVLATSVCYSKQLILWVVFFAVLPIWCTACAQRILNQSYVTASGLCRTAKFWQLMRWTFPTIKHSSYFRLVCVCIFYCLDNTVVLGFLTSCFLTSGLWHWCTWFLLFVTGTNLERCSRSCCKYHHKGKHTTSFEDERDTIEYDMAERETVKTWSEWSFNFPWHVG